MFRRIAYPSNVARPQLLHNLLLAISPSCQPLGARLISYTFTQPCFLLLSKILSQINNSRWPSAKVGKDGLSGCFPAATAWYTSLNNCFDVSGKPSLWPPGKVILPSGPAGPDPLFAQQLQVSCNWSTGESKLSRCQEAERDRVADDQ